MIPPLATEGAKLGGMDNFWLGLFVGASLVTVIMNFALRAIDKRHKEAREAQDAAMHSAIILKTAQEMTIKSYEKRLQEIHEALERTAPNRTKVSGGV